MKEEMLKTSTRQRIFNAAIAVITLVTLVASCVLTVQSSQSSTQAANNINKMIAKYESEYNDAISKIPDASSAYFGDFAKFTSRVSAYNEVSANAGALHTEDLKEGTGRVLTDGDYNYLAFYIGWCPDETVFDSTLDNAKNPTKFKSVLTGSENLIEGWLLGVVGMKLGGVRELTIPSELAYKDGEICCGTNKPHKFIVMPVENTGALAEVAKAADTARTKLQYAYYGIDYESPNEE